MILVICPIISNESSQWFSFLRYLWVVSSQDLFEVPVRFIALWGNFPADNRIFRVRGSEIEIYWTDIIKITIEISSYPLTIGILIW